MIINKLKDSLFHEGAIASKSTFTRQYKGSLKFEDGKFTRPPGETVSTDYTLYSYGDKLGRYAAGGAAAGAAAAMVYNPDTDGLMRGAAFGAAVGAGVNVLPKAVHNTLARTGVQKFKEMDAVVDEHIKALSPLGGTGMGSKELDGELIKEFGEAIAQARNKEGNLADNVVSSMLEGMKTGNILKGAPPEKVVKAANLWKRIQQADENLKGVDSTQPVKNFIGYLDRLTQDIERLEKKDRLKTGAALAAKLGFDSAMKHIANPAGEAIQAIRNKNYKEINFEKGAALAFATYGLYETAKVASDVSEGNWGNAVFGLGMLGAGKMLFGMSLDIGKIDAKRRLAGISDKMLLQLHKNRKNFEDFGKAMQEGPLEKSELAFVNKVNETTTASFPNLIANAHNPTGHAEALLKDFKAAGRNTDAYKGHEQALEELLKPGGVDYKEWGGKYSNTKKLIEKDLLKTDFDDFVTKIQSPKFTTRLSAIGDSLAARAEPPRAATGNKKKLSMSTDYMTLGLSGVAASAGIYATDRMMRGEDASMLSAATMGFMMPAATIGFMRRGL